MTKVSIAVDDAHLATISAVADALRVQGLRVDQVLGELGLITGTIAQDRRASLEAVDGVATVAEEQHYEVPPPDAPIQ